MYKLVKRFIKTFSIGNFHINISLRIFKRDKRESHEKALEEFRKLSPEKQEELKKLLKGEES